MDLYVVEKVFRKFPEGTLITPEYNKVPLIKKDESFSSFIDLKVWLEQNKHDVQVDGFGIYQTINSIAFDIDRKHDKDATKEIDSISMKINCELPNTYSELTPSKGFHLYYLLPYPCKLKQWDINGFEGKQSGKISIAAGNDYLISDDIELSVLPKEWFDYLSSRYKSIEYPKATIIDDTGETENPDEAIDFILSNVGYPTDGHRHFWVLRFAGQCCVYGVSQFDCEREALRITGCRDDKDTISCVNYAYSNGTFGERKYKKYEKKKSYKQERKEKLEKLRELAMNKIAPTKIDRKRLDEQKSVKLPKITKINVIPNNEKLSKHLVSEHFKEKHTYIKAPTGSGKTTAIFKKLPLFFPDKKFVFIVPVTLMVRQKEHKENKDFDSKLIEKVFKGIDTTELKRGKISVSYGSKLPNFDSTFNLATYDKLKYFNENDDINLNDYILIVDEEHLLVDQQGFREEVLNSIFLNRDRYYKTISMSATPHIILDDANLIKFEYEKRYNIPIEIVRYPVGIKADDLIFDYLKGDGFNAIFRNNYRDNKILKNNLKNEIDKKFGLVNRDTKNHPASKDILDCIEHNMPIDDSYDGIIATSYAEVGTDFIIDKKFKNAIFLNMYDYSPDTVIQSISRFRDNPPEKIIIYLRKSDTDYDFNFDFKDTVQKYIEQGESLIEAIENRTQPDIIDYRKIENGIIKNHSGQYVINPYRMQYEAYQDYIYQFFNNPTFRRYCLLDIGIDITEINITEEMEEKAKIIGEQRYIIKKGDKKERMETWKYAIKQMKNEQEPFLLKATNLLGKLQNEYNLTRDKSLQLMSDIDPLYDYKLIQKLDYVKEMDSCPMWLAIRCALPEGEAFTSERILLLLKIVKSSMIIEDEDNDKIIDLANIIRAKNLIHKVKEYFTLQRTKKEDEKTGMRVNVYKVVSHNPLSLYGIHSEMINNKKTQCA